MDSTSGSKSKQHQRRPRKSSRSSPSHSQRLVEYSDVSSNELSAPEAGELPSDGLSIVSDDEISTPGGGTNNNNNIYEPIDDDDEEALDKLLEDDDEAFSEGRPKRRKGKRKAKKVKKAKKRKRRRQSSDSIEEISEDDAILDEVEHKKKVEDGFTPPLDQISYTPKRKFEAYTPISTRSVNGSPGSPMEGVVGMLTVAGSSKRGEYRSPHTPPMPVKASKHGGDERGGGGVHGGVVVSVGSGRHSSMSSSE
jgi:hypothetical protein